MRRHRFYEEQLDLIRQSDAAALVEKHDHPDAVFVTPERVVKARAALEQLFRSYIPTLGNLKVNTEVFVEQGDVCLIEAEIDPGPRSRRVYDVFVLQSGRIIYHFAGVFPQSPSSEGTRATS
jgi:ketosteroid isomerase-like protein